MKKGGIIIASLVVAAVAAPASAREVKGSLVVIGGSLRVGDMQVWTRIVELAGGPGSRIAVFPTASNNPVKSGNLVVERFKSLGADAFFVPIAVTKFDVDYRQAVNDPQIVAQVKGASGIFFVGGEQEHITRALVTPEGKQTPVLEAVWEVYERGGVIAGTSAGAAIMSRIMYRDAKDVLGTMLWGVTMGKEIDRGLGFFDEAWFVDQHLLVRGRFARTLVAMHDQGFQFGIGIDENTAMVVTKGTDLKVIGYKGALVMDLSASKHDPSVKGFNLKNVKLTYLDRGDSINLKTREVIPAPEKLKGSKIDPAAANFVPYFEEELFYNDILGNTTVADLMGHLIDNKTGEAIGLAFRGSQARQGPVPGFEFRFYRTKDSLGWFTEVWGNDDYTVTNIHLDIRPIEIAGPLYR